MLQALVRTFTEILDSKKAAYSFIATLIACVLYLYFKVSVENAMLLVSPLGVATVAQAHVDAKSAGSTDAGAAATTSSTTRPTTASGSIDTGTQG